MPTYEHICHECQHEWEDIYKMNDSVPDVCPNCQTKGKVQRLISAPGKGKVELYGQELTQQLRKEGKDLAKELYRSESKTADFYGF